MRFIDEHPVRKACAGEDRAGLGRTAGRTAPAHRNSAWCRPPRYRVGEQFLDVQVGQQVPHVPAHRQRDHLGWEAKPGDPERATATRCVDLIHSRVPNHPADRPRFQRNSAAQVRTPLPAGDRQPAVVGPRGRRLPANIKPHPPARAHEALGLNRPIEVHQDPTRKPPTEIETPNHQVTTLEPRT